MRASDAALGNGGDSSSPFTITPSDVRPKARNETGNSGCNRDEVVGTGIKGSCFVQFPVHASQQQDGSRDLQSAKSTYQFESIARPGMGMTFRLEVEFCENQIEPRLLNFALGRFDGMGDLDMELEALKRLSKPSTNERFVIDKKYRFHSTSH
jgi:hypothetical protein